ncbi:Ig-like domain-containing protein, partial [Pikeienuella sp. HZG-20]|uniref:Ig-like domain-containing protein n=1 Tax=Paludibacillus litoralis TaxID=3133267 RepID=UPI0030ED53F1
MGHGKKDDLKGGNGDDTLVGTGDPDSISGGNGNDLIFGYGADGVPPDIDPDGGGENDNDKIKAGNGDDTVYAGGGNDEIKAGNGDDTVHAGGGNDDVEAGNGDDVVFAGAGNDEIKAGNGDDTVHAGGGNDEIKAGNGDDRIDGGSGDDFIDGGNGFDTAALQGTFDEYEFSFEKHGKSWIFDGPSGRDTLKSVEAVEFEDGYTLLLDGTNNTPYAVGDAITTDEDSATLVGSAALLANDIDFEGDALRVASVGPAAFGQVTASLNPDGSIASVAYAPNGQFESLAAGETATDTFGYTVADGNGGTDTATATVTITGVNDGPNAVADMGAASEDGPAISIDLTGNDSDPDASDDLEVIGLDTTGALGAVLINPDGEGVTYDPNGQFESLAAGETAADTFSYTVADGNGGTDTATATVTITGVNDGPNAVADMGAASEDGPAISIDLTGNDSDPDASDDLEVIGLDTTGALGAVLINPDGEGVTYDPNGQFESLAAGETAADTFSYTVADGNGGTDTATATVTITGVNDGPNAVADTGAASEDGPAISIDLTGNDSDPDASDDLEVIGLDTTGALGA